MTDMVSVGRVTFVPGVAFTEYRATFVTALGIGGENGLLRLLFDAPDAWRITETIAAHASESLGRTDIAIESALDGMSGTIHGQQDGVAVTLATYEVERIRE